MTEDTAERRLAKIIGRLDGMSADMCSDMNDIRQRLLALDALIADEEQAVTNLQLRAQLRAEQAWSRRLSDVHRVWAQRLEQHGHDLEGRLFELGLTEGAMLDPALLDIIDRLNALRHDATRGGERMTDTAARRLAKIIGRLDGMSADMCSDMNDIRQRLLALDALIADEEQAVTNLQLRAQLRAEQAWSRRLSDVHRVWAQRLEQHGHDLEGRLFELGLTEGAMLDPALLDIIDRLNALRHDMEEAGTA